MIFRTTSRKPVLLVGNGARQSGCADMIREFAEKTDIPVLTTMNAVDLAQDDLHIGFIGTHGNRIANMILNECDLVISVGARLGLRQIGSNMDFFAPKAELIRCDIDQYELARCIKDGEEKHLVDAKRFMGALLEEDVPRYTDWRSRCLEAARLLEGEDVSIGNLVIREISSLLPVDPVVAVDVGQHMCWSAQSLHLRGSEGRVFVNGGFGGMGCALPIAIGASIATGGGKVFAIIGDGGMQMNIQELETVKREGLPIKMIVLDNRELGKISETQHGSYDDRFAQTTADSGYTTPDFARVAEAYGIKAAALGSYEELPEHKQWLDDDQACLISISLPGLTPLVPKISWGSGSIEPQLDEGLVARVEELLG
ncbi:thiamine pyrophosphate-binding protein [Enterorhabdus sp. P55]|nr:thiamine pyrophosphate-binding protein [Enterorhabdus sp. P55]